MREPYLADPLIVHVPPAPSQGFREFGQKILQYANYAAGHFSLELPRESHMQYITQYPTNKATVKIGNGPAAGQTH